MRILHTSDWHLGKSLGGISRTPEHRAFCDEVVTLCDDEGVDLVLLTGDVFDTYNPPIEAEELFFDTMARLGDRGKRAVVVIAGNHDSPDRLSAAVPLAASHGVWILGHPHDVPRGQPRGEGRVRLLDASASRLLLGLPGGEQAHVAALPYPSEARLRRMLSLQLDERRLQAAYSERIGQLLAELCARAPAEAVSLAASHLAVRSCMPSESERALVGGAYQVEAAHLPPVAYTALGHLHQPQTVADAPALARYAGAPLAFRMSERDHQPTHSLVELSAGGEPTLRELPVQAGRPLVVWEAGSVGEVVRGVEEGLHADALIELHLSVTERLTHAQMATLQKLPRTFLRIRVLLPAAEVEVAPEERLHALPPRELFASFYRRQEGTEPTSEVVELFAELLEEAR
jgi:exonuclease SbcD